MWYRKNVASPERWARVIVGALLIVCGLLGLHASPLGMLLAGTGAVSLGTALFGYCPACALAGRRPLDERR